MRKITEKKDNKKNQKLIVFSGIFLVLIMLFSTIGYSFMSMEKDENSNSVFNYRGFYFIEKGDYFFTNIDGYDFAISTDPRDISMNLSANLTNNLDSYSGLPLYYNSENNLALNEVMGSIEQVSLRKNGACPGKILKTNNKSEDIEFLSPIIECNPEDDFPIKDCSENNIIIIQISEESKITQSDKCVFISGSEENILAVTDEFILKTLGILA